MTITLTTRYRRNSYALEEQARHQHRLAVEQALWWRARGWSVEEVMRAVGHPGAPWHGWDDAVVVLAEFAQHEGYGIDGDEQR